jgi:hypothetical protein
MIRTLLLSVTVVTISMAGSGTLAQTLRATVGAPPPAAADVLKSNARNSELNSLYFDLLANEIGLDSPRLLVVSHLGSGERSVRLHTRRLHNARERWSRGNPAWRKLVLVAAGERGVGTGSIEFYVDGVRRWVVTFDRGDDFYVDCCEAMPEYYPWYRGKPNVSL